MAVAITKLQCSKFGTPSLFVTVILVDTTGLETYVAGKPVSIALESGYACFFFNQRLLVVLYLLPIIIVLPVL